METPTDHLINSDTANADRSEVSSGDSVTSGNLDHVPRETSVEQSQSGPASGVTNTPSSAPTGAGDSVTSRQHPNSPPPEPTHTLTLRSHEAQALWRGRQGGTDKPAVTGCLAFSKYAREICQISRDLDDPYADYQLIKIEKTLAELEHHVAATLRDLKALLAEDEDSGLSFNTPITKPFTPEEYPVLFASGYGYAAARLLGHYDRVIVLSLTARNCALMTDEDWRATVPDTSRRIRAFYLLGRRFRFSGASRSDFASNNARAQAAVEKYGPVPDDIMQELLLPKLLPKSWRAKSKRDGTS